MDDARATQVEVLWLDVLQQLAARAAHEVKGALNGVCVNVEVVRARSTNNAAGPASTVARFAEAAANQLESLVTLTEALLALTRRPRELPDVVTTTRQLVALLEPVARADGGSLVLAGNVANGGATSAAPAVVRLVVANALLRVLDRRAATTCHVEAVDGMVIRIECADGGVLQLDPPIAAVAAEAGVRIDSRPGVLSLAFPRAGRGSGRRTVPTRETA